MQAKIVIAPAVSDFIVRCAVLREAGAVFYECCYDKCGSLRSLLIEFWKAFCGKFFDFLRCYNGLVQCCL